TDKVNSAFSALANLASTKSKPVLSALQLIAGSSHRGGVWANASSLMLCGCQLERESGAATGIQRASKYASPAKERRVGNNIGQQLREVGQQGSGSHARILGPQDPGDNRR